MRHFGSERLQNFDKERWQALHRETEKQTKPAVVLISGNDDDRYMVHAISANVQAVEVDSFICFDVQDAQTTRLNGRHDIMISNPSYGARLARAQALQALYPQFGAWLRQYYAGWLVGMSISDRDVPKFICLSPRYKIPLFNGNLDRRLFLMDMVKSSNRG